MHYLIQRHGKPVDEDVVVPPDTEHTETATEDEDGLGTAAGIMNAVLLGIICWTLAIGIVLVAWRGLR